MDITLDFIFSSLLLLALVSLYEFATTSITFKNDTAEVLLSGAAIGSIACVILSIPVNVSPGIFVDARWVLLSCSALFFNWRITVLGGIIAAVYRYLQGGAGAVPGFFTVVVAVLLGLSWKYLLIHFKVRYRWYYQYFFDIILEFAMMGVIFLLIPGGKGPMVVSVIAGPLLILFPFVSTILALTLKHRFKDGVVT